MTSLVLAAILSSDLIAFSAESYPTGTHSSPPTISLATHNIMFESHNALKAMFIQINQPVIINDLPSKICNVMYENLVLTFYNYSNNPQIQ